MEETLPFMESQGLEKEAACQKDSGGELTRCKDCWEAQSGGEEDLCKQHKTFYLTQYLMSGKSHVKDGIH